MPELCSVPTFVDEDREDSMQQTPIERVLQVYGLMVALTPEEEHETRRRLTQYLAGIEADDNALAVEGLKFLRGPRPQRKRRRQARPASI
jgi:hypothetical protein